MNKSSIVAAMALMVTFVSPGSAAELKMLVGGSMAASLNELAPQFERATGHKLTFRVGATPELIKMALSEPFDLGLVPVDVMKNERARAKFTSPTDIARVGFGVAVRAGAPKPDISTPDAFKGTLLKANSIAFLPESAAGAYVLRVFERLAIADAMKAKTKAQKAAAQIAQAVANGEAELGVFLTNVMIAPGVELVGPFPGDLQQELVFVGAVAAESRQADAASAFLAFLRTPAAVAVFKAKGVTPG